MTRLASLLAVVFAFSTWAFIDGPSQAQDQTAKTNATPDAKVLVVQAEPTPKPRKAPAGRVPNGWGKLGLSAEQKKRIYAIQGEYKDQIADLEQQIEMLKSKQLEEMQGVLTAEQLAKLKAQDKSSKSESDAEKSDAKPAQSANSK